MWLSKNVLIFEERWDDIILEYCYVSESYSYAIWASKSVLSTKQSSKSNLVTEHCYAEQYS